MLDNVPNKPGTIGTPGSRSATRAVLLGAGELGREVAIALIRLGVEVTAIDRYAGAPAMQVAQHSRVIDMLDPEVLRRVLVEVRPDLIVPEIEAIATEVLMDLEKQIGAHVVPTAFAARTTMNREGIRQLACEELDLPTSNYRFATTREDFDEALAEIGLPCFVKPVMSSSGKGQSFLRSGDRIDPAWHRAQTGGRAGGGRVIVESPIDFDFEVTLLTVRHRDGTSFCEPIGHRQEDGDYRESWQPQAMTPLALERARDIATRVTDALGGWGIFGIELFIRGDEVWFSEVSPRPHDTGMVTLISQNLSEFELHARAILGLPIPEIRLLAPSASVALLGSGDSSDLVFSGIDKALAIPDTDLRLFGKPEIRGTRRLGVALASADSVGEAIEKTLRMAATIAIDYR